MATKRLDAIVAEKTKTSRSHAAKLIEDKKVRVNSQIQDKPSKKIDEMSELIIDFVEKISYPEINIKTIYEDKTCVVVDKPSGILTHSKGAFNPEATLATWLHARTPSLDKTNQRSGVVHRLDRGTSGVIVLAKNKEAQDFFQKQFAKRNVKKTYIALVEGEIEPEKAIIDIPIIRNTSDPKRFKVSNYGKSAQTLYKVIKVYSYKGKKYSLIELKPKTGRTHQIRVHLKYLNRPIVGDDFYDGAEANRLYLHAEELELTLPNSERKVFTSPLPKNFLRPKIKNND